MSRTLKLAWRNLGRNRRRTGITGMALIVGVALSVAGYGLIDGMNAELLRALTRNELGHVQVHNPAYPDSHALGKTLNNPAALIETVSKLEDVVGVAPRVYGFALLSAKGKSIGVQLVGVEPMREQKVTTLDRQRVAGDYLDTEPTPWPRGRALSEEEQNQDAALTAAAEAEALQEIEGLDGEEAPQSAADTQRLAEILSPPPRHAPRVYMGAALAKTLSVGVGDKVHATGQTADGQAEETFFEIAGLFRTGTAGLDRGRLYLHIVDMQRFVHLYDRIHELSIVASSPHRAPQIAAELRAVLSPQDYLVRTWSEIRPDVKQMLDLNDVSMTIMIVIIFFVAALGVVNTMLMAVLERTRELGMLKALGMPARNIVGLIVAETFFLVALFSILGTSVGLLADWYMVVHGIDLSSVTSGFSVGGVTMNPVFHGEITTRGVVYPSAILAVTCFVASFYPAVRAARLRPAVGMRQT